MRGLVAVIMITMTLFGSVHGFFEPAEANVVDPIQQSLVNSINAGDLSNLADKLIMSGSHSASSLEAGANTNSADHGCHLGHCAFVLFSAAEVVDLQLIAAVRFADRYPISSLPSYIPRPPSA